MSSALGKSRPRLLQRLNPRRRHSAARRGGSEMVPQSFVNAKEVFLLFYAVFWGVLLPSAGKFEPFNIDDLISGDCAAKVKNLKRFGCAILMLNIFPVLWFFILLNWIVPDGKITLLTALADGFASLSIFFFLNLGYCTFRARHFARGRYTPEEEHPVDLHWEIGCSRYFLWVALIYLPGFPALAWVFKYLATHCN